jgi:hypothetical protein
MRNHHAGMNACIGASGTDNRNGVPKKNVQTLLYLNLRTKNLNI